MRKVAGFIALGLLGGLIGTQLPGQQSGECRLKIVGLPAVAREVLEARGAHITQQDAVSIVEGASKEATFQALSFSHVVLEAQYNCAYHNLQILGQSEEKLNLMLKLQVTQDEAEQRELQDRLEAISSDPLQVRYDAARGTVENVVIADVNEVQEEAAVDQTDLGMMVVEKAMKQLDPTLVIP